MILKNLVKVGSDTVLMLDKPILDRMGWKVGDFIELDIFGESIVLKRCSGEGSGFQRLIEIEHTGGYLSADQAQDIIAKLVPVHPRR